MIRVPLAIAPHRPARAVAAGGVATPKSATTTRAPTSRASTLTAAPPRRKFSTICAVTDLRIRAHALGDDAVIGGEREDHRLRRRAGRGPSARPGATASSSSRPRLPGGLVRASRWRWAAAAAAASGAGDRAHEALESTGAISSGRVLDQVRHARRPSAPRGRRAAATRWFTRPRRSRKRSPSAVAGCTPKPTSLETSRSSARPDRRAARRARRPP